MLEQLSVRSYVLIDKLDIAFSDGFTILTGETGSGKSIMLGALSLLLGAKTDKETVRQGEKSAEISGVFTVLSSPQVTEWTERHGIEMEDGMLVIRRLIRVNGRSSYTVNGSPVTVKEGEELGHLLVDVSSQHSHQSLLKADVLRSMLDEFGHLEKLSSEYHLQYRKVREREKNLEIARENIQKALEEADYMRFSLKELDEADLKEGEEEELKAELEIMNSAEFLKESLSSAVQEMRTASSSLSQALEIIRKASRKDQRLTAYTDRTENIGIEADDILLSLRDHLGAIDFSETEMEEKNARLMQLQRIRRRFGGSIEEAIRRRDSFRQKLEDADNSESLLESLSSALEKERAKLADMAEKLLSERKKAASSLEKGIEENLQKLGMPSAEFRIRLDRLNAPGPDGIESVAFLIAPNKGEKLSPIQDTASGGELSRIMLSIKVALRSGNDAPTMLFDEIDSGIGGAVANAVGEEMKALSQTEQVIAITHLPQIASRANAHYLVEKEEEDGRTVTRIRKVEGEERVKEIARLLSGETSGLSLEHARALLEVQGK
ncbi:MAG: DNA repair protein RecN [Spirochaetes bacterium]|uniref:DNA repair protein RecN n=1 Tax=Candidatus Ornithospirochaeta stercoripullorum TaxID=2840899 RepID=A0A9D9H5V5_9SPIO|nr:DNA repair protein RecN [Candidatus Ornithospirochaeta stercoripullorum]